MAELRLGGKARIKQEAWEKFLKENNFNLNRPNPGAQTIEFMPRHTPYDDCVMLSFPFHWWKVDEVEPI